MIWGNLGCIARGRKARGIYRGLLDAVGVKGGFRGLRGARDSQGKVGELRGEAPVLH